MQPFITFENKVILVTGASVGIGQQTAIRLSQLGAKIILLATNEDKLVNTLSLLEGNGHNYFCYNLADIDNIESKVKEIINQCGKIDGFVNCVGIRSRRPISLLSPKEIKNVMDINFGSFIELIRCITKKGHFNEGLSIVGVSSIASHVGGVSVTAYAASKAAVEGAVRCLSKELAPKKIRLNTVVPAQINTPEYANLLQMNGGVDNVLNRQYLGLGEATDVANAIAFLLSPASKFITGISLPVDGGYLSS
jgi:NAD(P)-dependent dehydrogenase (short-subunit alcohol dehydrogenase family)